MRLHYASLLACAALTCAACSTPAPTPEDDPSGRALERQRSYRCDPRGVSQVDMRTVDDLIKESMKLAYEVSWATGSCEPTVQTLPKAEGSVDHEVVASCRSTYADAPACIARCAVENIDRVARERARRGVATLQALGALTRSHPECVPAPNRSDEFMTCLGVDPSDPVHSRTRLWTQEDADGVARVTMAEADIELHQGLNIRVDGAWQSMGCGTGQGWGLSLRHARSL